MSFRMPEDKNVSIDRRRLIGGLGAGCLGLVAGPAIIGRAQAQIRAWPADPFSLGVAAGAPRPDAQEQEDGPGREPDSQRGHSYPEGGKGAGALLSMRLRHMSIVRRGARLLTVSGKVPLASSTTAAPGYRRGP